MKRETQASQPETLLTPAEVAALFRVDPKTVTRWAKAGNIRVAHVGNVVRVDVASVERFLEMRANDFGYRPSR